MTSEEMIAFLKAAIEAPEARWKRANIGEIARLRVPDAILGRRAPVLRADVNVIWGQWFVESICDPEPFVDSNLGYAFIVSCVAAKVSEFIHAAPESERKELTVYLAQMVMREVERRKQARRAALDQDIRGIIIDRYDSKPRCWICGYAFTDYAIDRFLGRAKTNAPALPGFVDFAKPNGLLDRDLAIEIDHVVPVKHGGREGDNLRLACGWCNNNKSDRGSLYDIDGIPLIILHPRRGRLSAPRPFWVVRTLALQHQCEWTGPGGCTRTTENSELTVCAWNTSGAMNPTNLRATCSEHHPLGHERLISRDLRLASI